ncbi:NAD(P)/FAD-dependent oxidoreductase [Paludibacterium denitrificans]|uniref:NAD(P)/FAD-dependent oxidoreductase n=1 Tax=Paludibacterium denitrificans TaxID=2675226 RepID=UPI002477E8F4|nr:NAD(P)/FAD-dependent oxidoreductase [Paludibacterium denitrificans]
MAQHRVAIVGGGPAGLMAAEWLSSHGVAVDIYDAMPSVGRKFLLAGVGGMNITHSEPAEPFLSRYGARCDELAPVLQSFGAPQLREWVHGLGVETFVGSSGRVFPREMKAAPLLRALAGTFACKWRENPCATSLAGLDDRRCAALCLAGR